MLNYEIGIALGVPVHEFDELMKDNEVVEFRRHLIDICQSAVDLRNANGRESQALYAYPPEIENSPQLPKSMEGKLDKGKVKVAVWSLSESYEKQRYTVAVEHSAHPQMIIRESIFKRIRNSDKYKSGEVII